MKILVIDDDEGIRILAKHTFETEGHEVIEAETFTNGLRRVIEQQPDAVFYDLRLADQHEMDAAENLAKLKSVLPKSARIIAISGIVDETAIEGADLFIKKDNALPAALIDALGTKKLIEIAKDVKAKDSQRLK